MKLAGIGTNVVTFKGSDEKKAPEQAKVTMKAPEDITAFSKKDETSKIGGFRLFFKRLTNEQINAVNESKKLPKNAKFKSKVGGGYKVTNNWLNVSSGTKTLPAGFEVRKNFLGFTRVVPVDTEGLFIKKKK